MLQSIDNTEKLIIKRGDIFIADLIGSYKWVFKGEHPVIILSNWRAAAYSSLLYVVPLTSKNKNKDYHVKIGKECGLDKDSYALTEQMIPISRENLKYQVGKVTFKNLIEIRESIDKQMGFGGYINQTIQAELDRQIANLEELDKFILSNNFNDIKEVIQEREIAFKCLERFCINNDVNNIDLEKFYFRERNDGLYAQSV